MAALNTYLFFKDNCEEAFNYYKSVFGGEFGMLMRNSEVPQDVPNPGATAPNSIMHVSLPIGNGSVLMGSDDPYAASVDHKGFSISITVGSKEEGDKLFAGLSDGGSVSMPMGDTFWGSYFGMCKDKFGVHWMVSYDQPRG